MPETDYWYAKANLDRTYGDLQHQSAMSALVQQEEYNLVSILKPKIFIDGNQWCVLYGENPMEGIAGFGKTPYEAVIAFNKAFNEPITTTPAQGGKE